MSLCLRLDQANRELLTWERRSSWIGCHRIIGYWWRQKLPSLIGSLQWPISLAHRDITTAVIKISKFRVKPCQGHMDWFKLSWFHTHLPDFSGMEGSPTLNTDRRFSFMVKSLNRYLVIVYYLWEGKPTILHLFMHMCIMTLSLVEL